MAASAAGQEAPQSRGPVEVERVPHHGAPHPDSAVVLRQHLGHGVALRRQACVQRVRRARRAQHGDAAVDELNGGVERVEQVAAAECVDLRLGVLEACGRQADVEALVWREWHQWLNPDALQNFRPGGGRALCAFFWARNRRRGGDSQMPAPGRVKRGTCFLGSRQNSKAHAWKQG
eukprot:201917-Chlamydomonas_euryale.AAC.2